MLDEKDEDPLVIYNSFVSFKKTIKLITSLTVKTKFVVSLTGLKYIDFRNIILPGMQHFLAYLKEGWLLSSSLRLGP